MSPAVSEAACDGSVCACWGGADGAAARRPGDWTSNPVIRPPALLADRCAACHPALSKLFQTATLMVRLCPRGRRKGARAERPIAAVRCEFCGQRVASPLHSDLLAGIR